MLVEFEAEVPEEELLNAVLGKGMVESESEEGVASGVGDVNLDDVEESEDEDEEAEKGEEGAKDLQDVAAALAAVDGTIPVKTSYFCEIELLDEDGATEVLCCEVFETQADLCVHQEKEHF